MPGFGPQACFLMPLPLIQGSPPTTLSRHSGPSQSQSGLLKWPQDAVKGQVCVQGPGTGQMLSSHPPQGFQGVSSLAGEMKIIQWNVHTARGPEMQWNCQQQGKDRIYIVTPLNSAI